MDVSARRTGQWPHTWCEINESLISQEPICAGNHETQSDPWAPTPHSIFMICICGNNLFIWNIKPYVVSLRMSYAWINQFGKTKIDSLSTANVFSFSDSCVPLQMWLESVRVWTKWPASPLRPTKKCLRGRSIWWTCLGKWWLSHCGERK